MIWEINKTKPFLKDLKKHRKNNQLLKELKKAIERLEEDPKFGGTLSGNLYGKRSTRLTKKIRLIFKIEDKEKTVFLIALDHRESIY